MLMPLLTIFQL